MVSSAVQDKTKGDRPLEIPSISVVVPVFRSAPLLPALVQRLTSVLDAERRPWEIILVDDASLDDSYAVMRRLRAADSRVRIVQFARNHGQQHASLCGLNYARGEEVVTMDDDLQNPPEEIPRIWERLFRGDRSRSQRGLGLGLSLVKAIVETHGGTVSVRSTVGVGSTFSVMLPR